jgi:chromosome segregation ATPase
MHPLSAALSDMAQRCSDLEEKYSQSRAELTQKCSDLKEKYSQSQADLAQTSASLDGVRSLNSSLNAQLDSERMAHEVNSLG